MYKYGEERTEGRFSIPLYSLYLSICKPYLNFAFIVIVLSDEPRQNQGRGLVDRKLVKTPSHFYCWPSQGGSSAFGSLVILDVARCYLWLFTLYINIKIGKNSC